MEKKCNLFNMEPLQQDRAACVTRPARHTHKKVKGKGKAGKGGEKEERREGEREEADGQLHPTKSQHRKARCRVRAMV